MDKAAERTSAIHLRRLDDLLGQPHHELAHQEDVKRRKAGGQNHRPWGIQKPQRAQGEHVWHHRHLKGQEHQHNDDEENRIPPAELEAAQGVGHCRNYQRLPKQNRAGVHGGIEQKTEHRHIFDENIVILAQGKYTRSELDLHPDGIVVIAARFHKRLDLLRGEKRVQRRKHHRQQNHQRQDCEDGAGKYVFFSQ